MPNTPEAPPRTSEDQQPFDDMAEKLFTSPRRDISFYLVLMLAVIPIWSVVPLSWGFVIYALRTGGIWSYGWRGWALFGGALLEVFFSVYQFNLARWIDSSSPPPSPYKYLELFTAFKRVLQAGLADLPEYGYDDEDVGRPGSPAEDIVSLEYSDPRALDFRNYIRTWFGKVPWSSIHRNEMYAWLCWAIFNEPFTTLAAVPSARRDVLREVLAMIEKRAGAPIPGGSNPDVKPLLLTLDPISISWRPFFWYAGVTLSNYYIRHLFKRKWNATIATYNGLEYILRIPRTWAAEKGQRPVVFLHGLGLGLSQYKIFLNHLLHEIPDRPVLIPLQPHVSQEIFNPRFLEPMNRGTTATTLAELLEELGWAKRRNEDREVSLSEKDVPLGVTVVSHSNGSFIHSWMLKAFPEMITRSCFIDPVIFCSWEGDLCYNFIYRRPTNGMELVMKYFVGAELGVANFLQRHFDWNANALWYEEIPYACDPTKAVFFLGGKDAIVDASRVKRYLTSHGIREGLWFDPYGRHGQALLRSGQGHHEILHWLREPGYKCAPYADPQKATS